MDLLAYTPCKRMGEENTMSALVMKEDSAKQEEDNPLVKISAI
jgi:hypothetical protein